jgi:hypothetical protein
LECFAQIGLPVRECCIGERWPIDCGGKAAERRQEPDLVEMLVQSSDADCIASAECLSEGGRDRELDEAPCLDAAGKFAGDRRAVVNGQSDA